jgi:putative ABC transport system ATP-binding protein
MDVKGLTKEYRQNDLVVEALSGISFTLEQNLFTIVTGSSGSGKTTLLNVLGGLDRPSSGTVKVLDVDLTGLNEQELAHFRRKEIGFIFQAGNLISTLTVFENIELPLLLTGQKKGSKKRVESILEDVGLLDKRNLLPKFLSGGEQQRAAIARALVHSPKLVLADEPTAHLDSKNTDAIVSLLDGMRSRFNTTVLLATHDLGIASKCNMVLEIIDGKLARC